MSSKKGPDGIWRWRAQFHWPPKGHPGYDPTAEPHKGSGTARPYNNEDCCNACEATWRSSITDPVAHAARIEKAIEQQAVRDAAKPGPRGELIEIYAPTYLAGYIPKRGGRSESANDSRRDALNNHIVPFFGKLPVNGVTQEHLDAFKRDGFKRGLASQTIFNRLCVLKTLIDYAKHPTRLGSKIAAWPPLDFGMSIERECKVRALKPSEVTRLVAAAVKPRDRTAILLAADAGLRAGEILGLMWGDIVDGRITIRRQIDPRGRLRNVPKGKEQRVIPTTARLAAALGDMVKRGLWLMTPDPSANGPRRDGTKALSYKGFNAAIKTVYKRAKIDVTEASIAPWHSLRHHAATELARLGVAIEVIQLWLGHKDPDTTRGYIDEIDREEQLDAAAELLNGRK